MAVWPERRGTGATDWQRSNRQWVADNEGCRQDILELLRADGPLPISELPDTCVRPWKSTGWNNNRNVTMLLGLMVQMGDVAAAGGTGRDRLWDLAERVYPPVPPVPLEEAFRVRDERRLARPRHRPAARTRAARSSRSTSARRASPPSSRASAASGGSTPPSSTPRSRAGPRCSPRSTCSCTTASA